MLDETRKLRVVALDDGEYFVDLSWTLTAAHGDVTFRSDWVHYAWPYLRMNPAFSGQQGGIIVDDLFALIDRIREQFEEAGVLLGNG